MADLIIALARTQDLVEISGNICYGIGSGLGIASHMHLLFSTFIGTVASGDHF